MSNRLINGIKRTRYLLLLVIITSYVHEPLYAMENLVTQESCKTAEDNQGEDLASHIYGMELFEFFMEVDKQIKLSVQLMLAAEKGDLKKVQELVAEGANIHLKNRFGGTALHKAALGGYE